MLRFRKILVTGGAGFVGGNLAVFLRHAWPDLSVTVCDNLKRRGSELQLTRLKSFDIPFLHGDIRCRDDVESWPAFDLLIDCSAEPSVQAGLNGSPRPVIENNLAGAVHCLEAARRNDAAFLFMSTSRVYPVEAVNQLAFDEQETRFAWQHPQAVPGFSERGIAETFPLNGARSLYGATKLSVELLLEEYAYAFRMPVLINRCGLLAGPWQMGKVDQGVIALWVARHIFGSAIRYSGFGGKGKQVRDVLHIDDFLQLVQQQLCTTRGWDARPYNVGGGPENAVSLRELTAVCQQTTGRMVPVSGDPATSPVDVRIHVSDTARAAADFSWKPRKSAGTVVEDIARWIQADEGTLRPILA